MEEIHLQDLLKIKKRTWIKLDDKFRKELFNKVLSNLKISLRQLSKILIKNLHTHLNAVYGWYNGERLNRDCTKKINHGIPLDVLRYLAKLVDIQMAEVEKHIEFIKGDGPANKIYNPKFPIKLNKYVGAVIGHVLHDGYLEEGKLRVVYSNEEEDNLKHFKQSVVNMLGASKVEFGEIPSKGGIRIDVPNIVGYICVLFGVKPGDKLKSNTGIPTCILKCNNKEVVKGFIESTISDEMFVGNHKSQIGGIIKITLNSMHNEPPKLLIDDMKMFKKLGIKIKEPLLEEIRKTKNSEMRYKWGFGIRGQRNFVILNNSVQIPSKRKQDKLIEALNSYKKLQDSVLIEKDFRKDLFSNAISYYNTVVNLAVKLTEKLGFRITQASIQDWRKGRYHCPITVVMYLGKLFNFSIEDLIKNIVSYKAHKMEKPYKPDYNYLFEIFSSIPEDEI